MKMKMKVERDLAEWAQASQDIRALAAFVPRAKLIELLMAGRIEEALDWLIGDSYFAATGQPRPMDGFGPVQRASLLFDPLELDTALTFDRIGLRLPWRAVAVKTAIALVDCFCMSPMEIILRCGDPKAFRVALDALTSPEVKKAVVAKGDHRHLDDEIHAQVGRVAGVPSAAP